MELLNKLQKDVTEHVNAYPNIDWGKVREVLTTIVTMIDSIAATLPAGIVKTILNIISSMIKMVINLLPA